MGKENRKPTPLEEIKGMRGAFLFNNGLEEDNADFRQRALSGNAVKTKGAKE